MKFISTIFLIFFICEIVSSQSYEIQTKNRIVLSLDDVVDSIIDADVVLFGEYHDDSICHSIQLQLTKKLFQVKRTKLIIGAEMFESDNQLIVDEYLRTMISTKSFEQEAWLWSNYMSDYKPILEFAKQNNLHYIATNIPRRYANVVYKEGFEGLNKLSKESKEYIARLPIIYNEKLPSYQEMLTMMHGNENLPKAQAIKDATMATFILKNRSKGDLFLHFNGCYHSDYYEGIFWYINQFKPKIKVKTISIIRPEEGKETQEKEYSKADYIIYIK